MSRAKKDRLFPVKPRAISDAELAQIVAAALRRDFGDTSSAIKRIGQLTNANLRAIKNWYNACHSPSSGHLLLLARSSPSILKFVLEQIGGADLWEMFELRKMSSERRVLSQMRGCAAGIYGEENCTINCTINSRAAPGAFENLNDRQLWFLEQLQQKRHVKTNDIALQWQISSRTAKTDMAKMVDRGLIRFSGSKKTGCYILLSSDIR
jgi:hypothetical protein